MAIFVFGSQKTTKAFSTWCPNWGSAASFQTKGWLTEASLSCRELNENMPVLRFGFRPSKMLVLNWKIKRTLSSGGAIWKSVQACFCAQGWLFDSSSSRRSRTSVMKQGWPQLPLKRHLVHLVFPERNHKLCSCSHAGIDFDWSSLWFLHLLSEGKLQEKRCFFAQTVNNSSMAEKLSHEPFGTQKSLLLASSSVSVLIYNPIWLLKTISFTHGQASPLVFLSYCWCLRPSDEVQPSNQTTRTETREDFFGSWLGMFVNDCNFAADCTSALQVDLKMQLVFGCMNPASMWKCSAGSLCLTPARRPKHRFSCRDWLEL